MVGAFIIFSTLAILLLDKIEGRAMRMILGIMLIIISLYFSFFKEKLAAILCKLKEQGITIVMVSHDVEFCAKFADMVSMFFDGQILTTDTPRRFFGNNSFYTTAANRMSRHVFSMAVTAENVVELCKQNREAQV